MKNNTKKTFKIEFVAYVKLGKGLDPTPVGYSIETHDKRKECSLTWDDVEMAAYDEMEKRFSNDDFPNMKLDSIRIKTEDGEFQAVSEDEYKSGKFDKNLAEKVLVLPEATYSLTPEFKKYLKLSEAGLVNFEFSAEKMKNFLDMVNS